ncbi:thioredoxin [Nitzschia inconspicua]|uniref:Thioredoxin n=1 Tax=Nitzschia inconspicua TaxID=303405 RepID=A0A9K3PBB5_9STRA|nr:thioredoxin [Nitzschia inconspicua]
MGPPRMRKMMSNLDMYRKVPVDLMEGTKRGSVLSYTALFTILTLFVLETRDFFRKPLVSQLALDSSDDARIRLNFNITMLDLKCDFAVIDVVSVLGTDQNVTAHVTKWDIDADGVRRTYKGRNRNQKDLELFDTTVEESIEELHANGEDAVPLDEETLQFAKNENDFVFVDFYASWCSHCRDLAPTWEKLAELMQDAGEHLAKHLEDYTEEDYDMASKVELPVMIGKVDCVTHREVCEEHNIRAYPTLRLFVDGEPWEGGDYNGHRTLLELVEWLYWVEEKFQKDETLRNLHAVHKAARERLQGENASDEEKRWNDSMIQHKKRLHHEWKQEDHPGCQLAGHLLLDRAPGNFHILARSKHHDLAPHMTNVSHMVHELYVGDPTAKHWIMDGRSVVPTEIQTKLSPLNGNVYPTLDYHESYHHYLKLVTTKVEGMKIGTRQLRAYQMLANSQLALYGSDVTPEAKFAYDLSPIAVTYSFRSRHWYDYMTSVFAIVGGVFTVVGMIEASLCATANVVRRRRR